MRRKQLSSCSPPLQQPTRRDIFLRRLYPQGCLHHYSDDVFHLRKSRAVQSSHHNRLHIDFYIYQLVLPPSPCPSSPSHSFPSLSFPSLSSSLFLQRQRLIWTSKSVTIGAIPPPFGQSTSTSSSVPAPTPTFPPFLKACDFEAQKISKACSCIIASVSTVLEIENLYIEDIWPYVSFNVMFEMNWEC